MTEDQKILDAFWNDLDTQLMVTAAHRYCLGRRSYIVSSCVEWLWKHHESFSKDTIHIIIRDTLEAIKDNAAGAGIDIDAWQHLVNKLKEKDNVI